MPSSHQHQTPARDEAEARVREARKAFDDQWEVFVEAKQRFEENVGNIGEHALFSQAISVLDSTMRDWHHAQAMLDKIDRSIP